MKSLPSYWTYDRFLKRLDNSDLKEIMAQQVKNLYEHGVTVAHLRNKAPMFHTRRCGTWGLQFLAA